jgi:hypothetical protein
VRIELSVLMLISALMIGNQALAAAYDPALGTLPGAQGWTYVSNDPGPLPYVAIRRPDRSGDRQNRPRIQHSRYVSF